MTTIRIAAAGAFALLTIGCTGTQTPAEPPTGSPEPTTPSSSPSVSPSPSASLSPSVSRGASRAPAATPTPSAALPQTFIVDGSLSEGTNAALVVDELAKVAGELPALKLDVSASQATLTVLEKDESVRTFRWSNDVIDVTASDFQYLGQATFDPDDYPLENIGRMFDIADLRGVRGSLLYQVQEYRAGDVMQTVSSLPESSTVFFELDGSALPRIGATYTADIIAGHEAVVPTDEPVARFSYQPDRGYHSETVTGEEIVTRVRIGGIPTVETRRPARDPNASADRTTFDPALIDPMVIAHALQERQTSPGAECEFDIRMDTQRDEPLMEIECEEDSSRVDLEGREIDG